MNDPYLRRFLKHFPIFSSIVLNPGKVAFILVLLAGLLGLFSPHYSLSLLIFALPPIAFFLERRLLNRIVLTPFSIIAVWLSVQTGVGIGMLVYAEGIFFDHSLLKIQLVTLCLFPIMWIAYRIGFGKIPQMVLPEYNPRFDFEVLRPLVWMGWFFIGLQVVRTLVLAQTGAMDRGDFGNVAQGRVFGIWTYFSVFPRFSSFGFFLAPLLWQKSNPAGKLILGALLGVYFTLAFTSGSRGLFLYPFLFIGVGAFFFRSLKSFKFDLVGTIVAIAILPLIVFIDAYRNTDSYRATRTFDIVGRLSAIDDAFEKLAEREQSVAGRENESLFTLGRALVAVSDNVIYEATPGGIPHAGFDNIRAVWYTWIPFFLVRDRPLLLDANMIMWRYLNTVDRTGRNISLSADAYRRFGWVGVPVVVGLFFWLYGVICGRFFKIYFTKNALFGLLLIIYLFTYFEVRPFSTVLTTWWFFAYEMPKHVVAMLILYFLVKKLLGLRRIGGAQTYLRGNG